LQKLVFESAWDKTLAPKDRSEIERVFSEIKDKEKDVHQAVILKTAFNHKQELLVTVLLNNYSKIPMSLLGKKIVYKENGQALGKFESAYKLEVPAQTSMPWTFIFPSGSWEGALSGESGELEID
jgi:SLAP domain-containing protein